MPIRYLDEPPPTAEIVVIGGGVIGAATAFHAARAGIRPLIVEARPQLCTLTTPVAAGAFRLQFGDLEELELARESAAMFLDFEEATGQREHDIDVRQRGYLWLTTDEETAARQRALVERLRGWDQSDVEIVDGDEVRRRWPWVAREVIQARWRAGDGFIDTKQLTFGLACGAGADVVTSAPATGFRIDGGRLAGVETARGAVSCEAAVICAGPFSRPLAQLAGIELPIATVARQKLILPTVPDVPADGPMVIDEDTGAHWRPAHERGAWLMWSDPSTPVSEPTMDVATDHRFAFQLLDPRSPVTAGRVVPFWRDVWERGADHWMLQAGQYAVTPDQRALIGATGIDGLFVNAAYGGQGIMLGPAGSRVCIDVLVDPAAPNAFLPGRSMSPVGPTVL